MKKRLYIIILAGAIVIVFFYGYLHLFGNNNQNYELVRENCERLKVGMNKYDVREIMGEPKSIKEYELNGIIYETWFFDASWVASTIPQCNFDKKDEKVVDIICKD